jgi:hypothetical protein
MVLDRNRADVAAIVVTFDADFSGKSINPPVGADLVWSPTNAEPSVLAVINGAKHTLAIENEEMNDPAVTNALAAAARRGVRVEITMTADPEWNEALGELAQAGVHIRLYPNRTGVLYIHAKALVADAGRRDQRALVGSQNFSVASLNYNRAPTLPSSRSSTPRSPPTTLTPQPTLRPPARPGRRLPERQGAPPPQASTTRPDTRTTSTCTRTSPISRRPRQPAVTPTATRPTARATH